MTSAVEQGIRNYAIAQLGAVGEPRVFQMETTPVSLHCNTGIDELPATHPRVMIGCLSVPHEVGPLYMGMVKLHLHTPALPALASDLVHRSLVKLVRGLFPDIQGLRSARAGALTDEVVATTEAALHDALAKVAALSANVLATANCTLGSWFVEGSVDTHGKAAWQTEISLKCVLLEQPPV